MSDQRLQALQAQVERLEQEVEHLQCQAPALTPPPEVQLLGCEHSLFTGVARAYLVQKQIPYEEIVATDEIYKKVIVPKAGRSMIPCIVDLASGGKVIQDSSDIIQHLERRYPSPSIVDWLRLGTAYCMSACFTNL